MNLKNIFLVILFICCAFIANAQEKSVLSGQVVDGESLRPISYIHIILESTGRGTATDENGRFNIMINPSDTLKFSGVGYVTRYICFEDSSLHEGHFYPVILEPSIEMLDEVDIFPFRTYAQFKSAVIQAELPDEFVMPELDLEHIIGEAVAHNRIENPTMFSASPISYLYNRFSKEGKEKREYARLLAADHLKEKIEKRYNKEIVMALTGIDDNQVLEEFMEFCQFPTDFILNVSEYDLLLAINECYKSFIAP
ncbi:MAG: hypothetical protein C0594_13920 [Marinilabiliales bacterium]|nr:MAG: hypothetical protein C0594_13920 [Marinilabiliales bacterium]